MADVFLKSTSIPSGNDVWLTDPTSSGGATIEPVGIPSAEAFGAPLVGAVVAPAGIASATAFGAPAVGAVIAPAGIASAAAFGLPTVGSPSPPPAASTEPSTIYYDPRYHTWNQWATMVIVEAFPLYNLPNPGPEGLWQAWATELLNIAGFAERGVPDPRRFSDDWRRWAAAFIYTTL